MRVNKNSFSLLTHLILWYQATGEGYEEIFERIVLLVYTLPKQKMRGYNEEAGAFCMAFLPKIPRLVSKFSYTGRAFECYLAKSVRLQLNSYYRGKYLEKQQLLVMFHQSVMNTHEAMAACEEEVHEALFDGESDGYGWRNISKQRILILAMVKAHSVPPSLYGEIAEASGMSEDRISKLMLAVRKRESPKIKRYKTIQRRRDRYYADLLKVQYALFQEDSLSCRGELLERERKVKWKLDRANEKLACFPLKVSHHVVASLLNIPKGTVDSSMYYLKLRRGF